MMNLSEIASKYVKKTGFYQSAPPYYCHQVNPDKEYKQFEKISTQGDDNFGTKKYVLKKTFFK